MTTHTDSPKDGRPFSTDVLVVGGGYSGAQAATQIAAAGHKVVLIDANPSLDAPELMAQRLMGTHDVTATRLDDLIQGVRQNDAIEIQEDTRVAAVAGMPGEFDVRLESGGQTTPIQVGALVVASDLVPEPMAAAYGLTLSERVLSQSQAEALLAAENSGLAGKTVAFVVGFAQEGTPLGLERTLLTVAAFADTTECSVYVYVNNLKVAADGLEKLYKLGRDRGSIYFKLGDSPRIEPDGSRIAFHDPVLRRDVELAPDLIVVEEKLAASPVLTQLAELLRIDVGPAGFLQTDNVHRLPVTTNREGIFVMGASRDVRSLAGAFCDADNIAIEVRSLLNRDPKAAADGKAVVDRDRCAICLTCYRVCPHGAIFWDDKAVVSPLACQACGICASECPQDAIQVQGFEDAQVLKTVRSVPVLSPGTPRIVAFCCQNSAYEAGEMAATFGLPLPAGLETIKVPCAGKVDLEYIMNAFVAGADGVLLFTCHSGNCKSERGNTYAAWRAESAQRMLAEAGLEPERLQYSTIAANMGSEFAAVVNAMATRIQQLGLSPLR